MDLGLRGRVAIVTGASGGLGRAIARALAAEGCDLALTYHQKADAAAKLAAELASGATRVEVLPFDLGAPDAPRALLDAVLARFGRLDVLINNAVHWSPIDPRPFEEVEPSTWTAALRANIEGTYRLTQAAVAAMRPAGFGRIVNISAIFAVDGFPGTAAYSMAKAASHGLTRTLAVELGPTGILVNAVLPGLTLTEAAEGIPAARRQLNAERSPLRRNVAADEVARVVTYLASAANSCVTGELIRVSGGARAHPA